MALQVGELVAMLSVDDRQYEGGLRDAEQLLRRVGRQMGADADRAGQEIGDSLGDGIERGAEGGAAGAVAEIRQALDRIESEAGSAGRAAGDDLGDGLDQGASSGASGAVAEIRQALDRIESAADQAGDDAGEALGDGLEDEGAGGAEQAAGSIADSLGPIVGAAAALGLAAGAALVGGITDAVGEAMDHQRVKGRLAAQLGMTPKEAKALGHIAGEMYADVVVEDFQDAADAISAVMRAGIMPTGATNAQIEEISTKVHDLASTFELDLGQTANAVGQALKTGLAKDGTEAIDMLTRGMQKMGPRADDLMDTFNEYATQFRSAGLSGAEAIGLMVQGMQAGARDTDVIADAVKEFSIEAVAGADKIGKAWDALGLDSDELFRKMGRGGKDAREALDETLDALREMEPGTRRNALAVELFGTKAEDLGEALYSMDLDTATEALGKFGGAADEMGNSLRDNAQVKVEKFWRSLKQHVVDFIANEVIPVLERLYDKVLKPLARMWDEAGVGAEGFGDQVATFLGNVANKIPEKLEQWLPRIIDGFVSLGQRVGAWIAANPDVIFKIWLFAGAIGAGLMALPVLLGHALSMAAIEMGKELAVKFGLATVERLRDAGAAIGGWFSGLFDGHIEGPLGGALSAAEAAIGTLPGRANRALGGLPGTLIRVATGGWDGFQRATARKAVDILAYIRGLPGRAAAALVGIGVRLYSSGRALIGGFIAGIRSRVSEVASAASAVVAAARAYFPFSPAKKGPFSGRGYTSYSGAALIRGFEEGITGRLPYLEATLARLPAAPTYGVSPAVGYGGAGGHAGAGWSPSYAPAPQVVRIEFAGPSEMRRLIRAVAADGGGNVQTVFGR